MEVTVGPQQLAGRRHLAVGANLVKGSKSDGRVAMLEGLYVLVTLHVAEEGCLPSSQVGQQESVTGVSIQRRSKQVLGTMWMACALKECMTVVSGCCKVVLTIFVEGFEKHAGKFWKDDMKVFKQGMMSRKPGRGKCSVCCRSCCSADQQGRAVWAKQSCAVGLTNSVKVSGSVCARGVSETFAVRIQDVPCPHCRAMNREDRQYCRKFGWAKCRELDSALLAPPLRQGQSRNAEQASTSRFQGIDRRSLQL